MNPIVLAGPAVEPVSLADAKAYLRLDGEDEDELVGALIAAGRITVERATRSYLLAQQLRLTLPACDPARAIRIPLAPLMSVDAVRLRLADGSLQLLAPEAYRLDAGRDPAELLVDASALGATGRRDVQVEATCGYGAAASAVPPPLVLAVRRLVAFWFEERGDGSAPMASRGLPSDVAALIAPFVRPRLA